jgi:two-component system CheB/CheR fusion protein
MNQNEVLESLQERIRILTDEKRKALQALEIAVSAGDFDTSINKLESTRPILKKTVEKVSALVKLKSAAVFLVSEEDSTFFPGYCDPPEAEKDIAEEVELLIEDRTFAWALTRNKPLVVYAKKKCDALLLHPMGTPSRIRGVFVGILRQEKNSIPDATLPLLTMIFSAGAALLESYELYGHIRSINGELEENIERLEVSEAQLSKERAGLAKEVERQTKDLAAGNAALRMEIIERMRVEEQLRKAKAKAEDANRAKSEFLANISHELRTPMNGIMGMTELALLSEPPEESREYFDTIHSSAKILLALLNDILDVSKIEAERMVLEKEPFSLREIVGGIVMTLKHQAESKQTSLIKHINDDVPDVLLGDAMRFRQVLFNLVGNAVKFTDEGEVVVQVSALKKGRGENAELHFRVMDTGIGISDDDQDKIFKTFTQVDGSTTRKYGGTGLGLSIAGRLVEMMGGKIQVESRLGEGSTFSFSLVLPVPQAEIKPEREPEKTNEILSFSEPLRILLVEDNQVNMLFAERLLGKMGHVVLRAENGVIALHKLEESSNTGDGGVDAVLMDIQMPEMDGLEATKRIRQSGADYAAVPIVALTAHALAEDKRACLDAGMDHYIAKPIDFAELAAVLDEIVSSIKKDGAASSTISA